MITFIIDEITPCLKDIETGEIYETEAVRYKRKSVLQKFNKNTGWYVNWGKFDEDVEVYALVLKGTFDVQGLIALQDNDENKAIHIVWACTAPHNNKYQNGIQKYSGVGGHLFAIAGDLSMKRGYDGFVYGEAMDKDVMEYYVKNFGAIHVSYGLNPYGIMIPDTSMKQIMEVYDYEWTDDVL